MLEALSNTGSGSLFEATSDDYWGIGTTLHSKDTCQEVGKGINQLGLMLMTLHDHLCGDQVVTPSSAANQTTSQGASQTDTSPVTPTHT